MVFVRNANCVNTKNCSKLFNVLKMLKVRNEKYRQIWQIKVSHMLPNVSGHTSDESWKLLLQTRSFPHFCHICCEKNKFSDCSDNRSYWFLLARSVQRKINWLPTLSKPMKAKCHLKLTNIRSSNTVNILCRIYTEIVAILSNCLNK